MPDLLQKVAIGIVKLYQKRFSRKFGGHCVFEPSCSFYAIEALEKYGFWRGIIKIGRRLWRCRPPNGGFDPP